VTDAQIALYAGVRVRVPVGIRLRSLVVSDPFPFQGASAPGAQVIGIEGRKGHCVPRVGDPIYRYGVRADLVRLDPDAAVEEVAYRLVRQLEPEEHFKRLRYPGPRGRMGLPR
jgi:hypothetical protein